MMYRIFANVQLENRQALPCDLASQTISALTREGFDAVACNVTTVQQANWQTAGINEWSIVLDSPAGVSTEDVELWITDVLLALDIPTSPPIEIVSVITVSCS